MDVTHKLVQNNEQNMPCELTDPSTHKRLTTNSYEVYYILLCICANVQSETDLSTSNIIEPLEQLHHSALATPTWSNQGKRLVNFHSQAKVTQYLYKQEYDESTKVYNARH